MPDEENHEEKKGFSSIERGGEKPEPEAVESDRKRQHFLGQFESMIEKGISAEYLLDIIEEAEKNVAKKRKNQRLADLEKLYALWKARIKEILTIHGQKAMIELIETALENLRKVTIERMLALWEARYPDETLGSLAAKGVYLAIPVLNSNEWFSSTTLLSLGDCNIRSEIFSRGESFDPRRFALETTDNKGAIYFIYHVVLINESLQNVSKIGGLSVGIFEQALSLRIFGSLLNPELVNKGLDTVSRYGEGDNVKSPFIGIKPGDASGNSEVCFIFNPRDNLPEYYVVTYGNNAGLALGDNK
ncbi:MAG: hypothetical protein PHS07_01370 [Patescibacteria group bacterium]|jgi:hypothetical protein|nr:hypothetical protein [Patescibacteria group bacterium]